jgi:hypothetical protein
MSATRPLGKPRGVAFALIMSIVTLGIYFLYWTYVNFQEIKRWRGQGVNGVVGLLLSLIPVSIFLLPSYVGRMYKEDLIEKGEESFSQPCSTIAAIERHEKVGAEGALVMWR